MSRKPTKPGNLSGTFLQQARLMEEESLAYLFVSAFGITLDSIVAICLKIAESQDSKIAQLCVTAGVQIRNHVVYVGQSYGDVRTRYPELIIEGSREVPDVFNFSALHIAGHALAHFTSHEYGKKIHKKAGDCILGTSFAESEAAKINKEISESWTPEEKTMFLTTKANIVIEQRAWLDEFFKEIQDKATAFAVTINPTQANLQQARQQQVPIASVVRTVPEPPVAGRRSGGRTPDAGAGASQST